MDILQMDIARQTYRDKQRQPNLGFDIDPHCTTAVSVLLRANKLTTGLTTNDTIIPIVPACGEGVPVA